MSACFVKVAFVVRFFFCVLGWASDLSIELPYLKGAIDEKMLAKDFALFFKDDAYKSNLQIGVVKSSVFNLSGVKSPVSLLRLKLFSHTNKSQATAYREFAFALNTGTPKVIYDTGIFLPECGEPDWRLELSDWGLYFGQCLVRLRLEKHYHACVGVSNISEVKALLFDATTFDKVLEFTELYENSDEDGQPRKPKRKETKMVSPSCSGLTGGLNHCSSDPIECDHPYTYLESDGTKRELSWNPKTKKIAIGPEIKKTVRKGN